MRERFIGFSPNGGARDDFAFAFVSPGAIDVNRGRRFNFATPGRDDANGSAREN